MEFPGSRPKHALTIDRPLLKSRPQTRALGSLVEDIYPPVEDVVDPRGVKEDEEKIQFIRALTNWYRLQFLVAIGFGNVMSEEQRSSYRLLFDWWVAAYQDPIISIIQLFKCIGHSDTLNKENEMSDHEKHGELWSCIFKHLQVLDEDGNRVKRMKGARVVINAYSAEMLSLFVAEFAHPSAYDLDDNNHNFVLKWRRRQAVAKSYCQLVGMQTIRPIIRDFFVPTLGPLETLNLTQSTCSLKSSDPESPRSIEVGPLLEDCPWLPPMDFLQYVDSEDEDDEYGKSDDQEYEPLRGWPEYLWDIKNRCVVRTSSFRYDLPNYTVISHSWGRSALSGEGYVVPGGLKYPVPHNGAFDITTLPAMLESLQDRIGPSYVWLDIVCIPQGEERELDEEDQQLRLREIARQGTIFRNATSSIAWLHHVQDLSSLAALFEWLSIRTVHYPSVDEMLLDELKNNLLAKIKRWPPGLLTVPKDQEDDEKGSSSSVTSSEETGSWTRRVDPWFSSLWTLQELCLKPNMFLATSALEIMSTTDHKPIPLNGLLCVYNQCQPLEPQDEEVSNAMEELSDFIQCTGLKKLLDLTRLDILELSSDRYCGGRRDEAIMSSLGVTSWFNDVQPGQPDVDTDSTSRYHPKFVQEVRSVLPEDFMITPITGEAESRTTSQGAFKVILEMDNGESILAYQYYAASTQRSISSLLGVKD